MCSGRTKESEHLKKTDKEPRQIEKDQHFDAEAYFKFLEDYWSVFGDQPKKPREKIIITNRKF